MVFNDGVWYSTLCYGILCYAMLHDVMPGRDAIDKKTQLPGFGECTEPNNLRE